MALDRAAKILELPRFSYLGWLVNLDQFWAYTDAHPEREDKSPLAVTSSHPVKPAVPITRADSGALTQAGFRSASDIGRTYGLSAIQVGKTARGIRDRMLLDREGETWPMNAGGPNFDSTYGKVWTEKMVHFKDANGVAHDKPQILWCEDLLAPHLALLAPNPRATPKTARLPIDVVEARLSLQARGRDPAGTWQWTVVHPVTHKSYMKWGTLNDTGFVGWLQGYQDKNYRLFVSEHKFPVGERRIKENYLGRTTIIIDFDGASPFVDKCLAGEIACSFVTKSGPTGHHVGWRIRAGEDSAEIKRAHILMVAATGADASCTDDVRVFASGGSWNTKDVVHPTQVTNVFVRDIEFTVQEVLDLAGPPAAAQSPKIRLQRKRKVKPNLDRVLRTSSGLWRVKPTASDIQRMFEAADPRCCLSVAEVEFYAWVRYCSADPSSPAFCHPSERTLAELLTWSRDKVQRIKRGLKARGLLVWEFTEGWGKYGRSACRYDLRRLTQAIQGDLPQQWVDQLSSSDKSPRLSGQVDFMPPCPGPSWKLLSTTEKSLQDWFDCSVPAAPPILLSLPSHIYGEPHSASSARDRQLEALNHRQMILSGLTMSAMRRRDESDTS